MINRISTFDLAKGIGIILMVAGHTHFPLPIIKFIYSFHMPLFFLISGIFFNYEKYISFGDLFRSRFRTLVIPFICFSLIVGIAYFILGREIQSVLINGWGGYALWFIPVLLFTEFLFWAILTIIKEKKKRFLITLLLLLVGYFFSVNNVHLPHKVEVVFMAVFFFNVGYTFSKLLKIFRGFPYWVIIGMLVAQFMLASCLDMLDMCSNNFGCFPWSIILALSGTIVVIHLSKRISEWNENNLIYIIVNWAGKNTLTILGLSPIITTILYAFLDDIAMPRFIIYLLVYTGHWLSLYILSTFFNKKAKFMVGKVK